MSTRGPTKVFDDMSFQQKMDFVTGLMFFPALTVMVFLRWRLGFRRVKLLYLIVMMVLLMACGNGNPFATIVQQDYPTAFPYTPFERTALGWFGVAVLAAGLIQNRIQWWDINRGVRWHTYSTGISWLEWPLSFIPAELPFKVPAKFPFTPTLRPSSFIIHRYFDPLVCIITANVIKTYSPILSGWLLLSAVALAGFEQALFDKQLEQNLNMLDGLVNSEVQKEVSDHYMKDGVVNTSARPLSLKETAGIATGIAPDIAKQIAIRQRVQEQRAKEETQADPDEVIPPLRPVVPPTDNRPEPDPEDEAPTAPEAGRELVSSGKPNNLT